MGRPLRDWTGRRVLITGASRGIGRAFARHAAARGARVALLARDTDALEALVAEVASRDVHAFPCDVSDRAEHLRAIVAAREVLGGIDVGVLNAGIGLHRGWLDHDLDAAERVLDVNVRGVLYGAHSLGRSMAERGEGWLVFMASIAGLVPVPGEAAYSASKHAVVGLADALSIELEPRGVHVLTVCPGSVSTGFAGDARLPRAARWARTDPEAVVRATWAALARGADRLVIPRRLELATAARGVVPSLVRRGTARATREPR